jgi:hypothetical protein
MILKIEEKVLKKGLRLPTIIGNSKILQQVVV